MVDLKELKNLPNILSIVRMVLAPIFMILVFMQRYRDAFIVIFIAALTDLIDGQIARRWKIQTKLGKILDPAADKVLIVFAVIALLVKFNFPLWVALIIISRDLILLIGGSVFLYRYRKEELTPNLLGKTTTFIQMTTLVVFVLNVNPALKTILILLTAFFTAISALIYFAQGYRLLFHKARGPLKINIPNQITILRILLIPLFILFLLSDITWREYVAAGSFILLALSDALDGYLARKRKEVTNFGKLIDPLADKLLVSSALVFLIGKGIDAWMAYTIIAREFAITGIRMVAATRQEVIAAKLSGKIKTVVQIIAIVAVIIHFPYAWHFMLVAVVITIYSGIEYLWASRRTFKELG
ncbi:CDP-diacylglycerol--glycerol-3-phosphate 3-phosphatidyltransferase [Candidatus Woesearchaeota archaeon]|nr:CDP-diacylglycerol--glycerol-3-phosphate 3-phosphatidyltransferase [Candidatus Woesearchaeota archaeon]